jgi:hypothetical protein
MTVITNFTNMPLENRFQAAVKFEPDGFEFRKPAELKIRFPEALPKLEMVGYAFDGAGGGFHLQPWDAASQAVTLAISHFSGAGTTAQSFNRNSALSFSSVNNTYFDARQKADHSAATSRRRDSQQLQEGRIDQQQFEENNRLTKELRVLDILRDGILPSLAAAAADCEIGRVTLVRLDQLEGETGERYGQGAPYRKLESLAPLVRCHCAHTYLEEYEKNPTANGRLKVKVTETIKQPLTGNSGTREVEETLEVELSRGQPR